MQHGNDVQKILGIALALMFLATVAQAQTASLEREYTPVVLGVGEYPFTGQAIDSLALFSFDSANKTWRRLPFQIDEVDASGNYLTENDGIADANDELVFMPGDAGDYAQTDEWPNGVHAQRWELELTEPEVAGQKAWVYLFKNAQPAPPVAGYLSYKPDPAAAGADTVFGATYIEGHSANGWLSSLSILKNGQFGPDLVDTQKLRVKGTAKYLIFTVNYEANEESAIQFVKLSYQNGPVRAFRSLEVALVPTLLGSPVVIDTAGFAMQFFPYSTAVGARNVKLDSATAEIAGVKLVRQSIDFSETAAGMKFYSENNLNGFTIDGVPDIPQTSLPVSPELTWLAANGDPGMFVNILEVPAIGDSQRLYFRDDFAGGTNDGTADTGDGKSIGDMGVQIGGTKIFGQFSFDLTSYYLPTSADPTATATGLKDASRKPLSVVVTAQAQTPTAVVNRGSGPDEFVLYAASPNPFVVDRSHLTISYRAPQTAKNIHLRIYNLLGQVVREFNPQDAPTDAIRSLTWDGRDFGGRLLPTGIYFYVLESSSLGRQMKKMLLVR